MRNNNSGLRSIPDAKMDLKQRVKNAISGCLRVQEWFEKNPNASDKVRDTFKREILSGKIVLLTEILELCYTLQESDLEDILEQLKQNILQ